MSYIGTKPTSSFASATSQTFTGNNSTTAFTLNRRVSAPEDLEVFVSNIQQQPTVSYTIGSTGLELNFDSAPPSGEFYVIYRSEAGTSAIDTGAARTANANTFTEAQTFSGGMAGTLSTAAQPNVTSTGTLTSFRSTGIDDNANSLAMTISDSSKVGIGTASPSAQLHIDEAASNSYATIRLEGNNRGGDIEMYQGTVPVSTIRTDQSGNIYVKTSGSYGSSSLTNKLEIPTAGGLKVRNAAATGPIVDIGTTSTSVADDGVIGGIDFSSGSSSTVNARLHARQYDTSENAGYFSNELRAPNGNSLGEVNREFMTQNAIGGVYIKRPMPSNIYYYRDIYKSLNLSASQSGTTFITLNQNDYFCSISCLVDAWTVDTSYPTSALMRRYGLTANTHNGRSTWSVRLTQYLDMGEYNTGATDHSSASVNFSLSTYATKSAGSNNGYLYIRYNTGSYTSGPATIRLSGIFLNARVDDQPITANL